MKVTMFSAILLSITGIIQIIAGVLQGKMIFFILAIITLSIATYFFVLVVKANKNKKFNDNKLP